MGKEMGNQLGTVLDVGLYEFIDNAKTIKVKVLFNKNHPIRAGMFIGNDKDGITWVDFRYENLPMFCFGCGLVGHNQENCRNSPLPFEKGTNPRGAWLRSKSYGRRLIEKKEQDFSSNPRKSMSGGQFSPIPKGLMDKMATMSLRKTTTQNAHNNTPTIPTHIFYKEPSSNNITSVQINQRKEGHHDNMKMNGRYTLAANNSMKRKQDSADSTITHIVSDQQQTKGMAGLEDKASQKQ